MSKTVTKSENLEKSKTNLKKIQQQKIQKKSKKIQKVHKTTHKNSKNVKNFETILKSKISQKITLKKIQAGVLVVCILPRQCTV